MGYRTEKQALDCVRASCTVQSQLEKNNMSTNQVLVPQHRDAVVEATA